MRAKILTLTFVSLVFSASASAQYYYPNNYYNSYNYGYGNNPNNGVVTFQPGYDSGYQNAGYNNCGSGYVWNGYSCVNNYNYNYIQPVSVSVNGYSYDNYYNNNLYGNYQPYYYNNYSLTPTTYAASNAAQNSATINGYVTVSGNTYNNQNVGTTWFQYGVNQNNLNWSTSPANVYYTTNTNAYLTGLNCGTTYYFRAVTSGQNGIQYGNVLAFTTSQCNWNYNNGYYGGVYYPNYNYQNWTPPQIQTKCYKSVKKTVKKRYYR